MGLVCKISTIISPIDGISSMMRNITSGKTSGIPGSMTILDILHQDQVNDPSLVHNHLKVNFNLLNPLVLSLLLQEVSPTPNLLGRARIHPIHQIIQTNIIVNQLRALAR